MEIWCDASVGILSGSEGKLTRNLPTYLLVCPMRADWGSTLGNAPCIQNWDIVAALGALLASLCLAAKHNVMIATMVLDEYSLTLSYPYHECTSLPDNLFAQRVKTLSSSKVGPMWYKFIKWYSYL